MVKVLSPHSMQLLPDLCVGIALGAGMQAPDQNPAACPVYLVYCFPYASFSSVACHIL